jgi:hypothetical protein
LRDDGKIVRGAHGDVALTITEENVTLVSRRTTGVKRVVTVGRFGDSGAVDVVHGYETA